MELCVVYMNCTGLLILVCICMIVVVFLINISVYRYTGVSSLLLPVFQYLWYFHVPKMKGQKDNTKRKKNSSGQYFPLYNTVMTEEQVAYNSSPLSFFICWATKWWHIMGRTATWPNWKKVSRLKRWAVCGILGN